MSFELAGKVIGDPEIRSIQEFAVLLSLADSTNKETLTCYPSVGRIAFMSRLSPRQVFRVLKAIERKGWVQIIRRHGKKKSQSSIYRIIKYQGDHQSSLGVSASQGGTDCQSGGWGVHQSPKPVKKEPRKKPEHLRSDSRPDPHVQDSIAKLFLDLTNKLKAP